MKEKTRSGHISKGNLRSKTEKKSRMKGTRKKGRKGTTQRNSEKKKPDKTKG
jgi:hypothetical protein